MVRQSADKGSGRGLAAGHEFAHIAEVGDAIAWVCDVGDEADDCKWEQYYYEPNDCKGHGFFGTLNFFGISSRHGHSEACPDNEKKRNDADK